jgi:hypothetical protein
MSPFSTITPQREVSEPDQTDLWITASDRGLWIQRVIDRIKATTNDSATARANIRHTR